MEFEVKQILVGYKFGNINFHCATEKILSLMDENKNRLTGASDDNKDDD